MRQFRPNPRVGEKHRPYNKGNLGYTYTIYRFYGPDDALLYVGETARIRKRIVDHQMGNPRGLPMGHEDGPKPWWREAARIELEHLPPGTTEREAMAIEREQIERLRPVYNRDYNDDHFDRGRRNRAIEYAHFEVDLATAEHERHDGTVRGLSQIESDTQDASNRIGFGAYSYVPNRPNERIRFSDPYRTTTEQVAPTEEPEPVDVDRTTIHPEVSGATTVAVPAARAAEAKAKEAVDPLATKPKGEFSSDGRGSTIALSVLVGLLIAALLAAGIVAFGM